MIRYELSNIVAAAIRDLVAEGVLPAANYPVPEISDTKQPEHGDYACNFAMVASKLAGKNPRELGTALAARLEQEAVFTAVEVAGPGFINLRLDPAFIHRTVRSVLAGSGKRVWFEGTALVADPLRINVEFVSVNPNGPITIGSGRGAAYGSTLCNVLEAAGHVVHREYYINDGVNSEQMRLFAESVRFYLATRIFGEWSNSRDVAAWDASLLELVNAFAREASVFQSAEAALAAWETYVQASDHPLAETARENLKLAYYRESRGRHLQAYVAAAYVGGSFAAPYDAFPDKGYPGDYVRAAAWELVQREFSEGSEDFESAVKHLFSDNGLEWFRLRSQDLMIDIQRRGLSAFGVEFDTWFSEQSLHDAGKVQAELDVLLGAGVADAEPRRTKLILAKGGKIEDVESEVQEVGDSEESEGDSGDSPTVWLRSTKFGDDMDRVLRRRDGRLTYIASDVAYHWDKFNRPVNGDKLITVLGPDHHGYIGRLHAVVAALLVAEGQVDEVPEGTELSEAESKLYASPADRDCSEAALALARQKLDVQIYQLVRFLKDGKPAPMRKRDGNIYALMDLLHEIGHKLAPEGSVDEQLSAGRDVARFFYLMRSHDTTFDFDLDLAEKQSDENPVFYVQYAHARVCSVLAKAADAGIRPDHAADLSLLTHPRELALIKKLADLPYEVERASFDYGVHRLATYAIELARAYHAFYDVCRVIQDSELALSQARVALCDAVRVGLRSTCELLGISSPERM